MRITILHVLTSEAGTNSLWTSAFKQPVCPTFFFFKFSKGKKGGHESSCAAWVLLSLTVERFTFHSSWVFPLCSHEFVTCSSCFGVLQSDTVTAKVRGLSIPPCCFTVTSCVIEMFSAPLKLVTLYMKGCTEEWHDTTVTMTPVTCKETDCSWLWSLNVIHSIMPLHLCGVITWHQPRQHKHKHAKQAYHQT